MSTWPIARGRPSFPQEAFNDSNNTTPLFQQPLQKQVIVIDPSSSRLSRRLTRTKPRFDAKVLALVRWLLRHIYKLKPNAFMVVLGFGVISFLAIAFVLNLTFKDVVQIDLEDILVHPLVAHFLDLVSWFSWWILLGIASSIGLGTGLPTFVLFLGPWIAKVTMTAYALESLNFNDHGKDAFQLLSPTILTESGIPQLVGGDKVTLLTVFAKVYLVCYFWGFGTAIGELPPYFVARAAAIAEQDDPDLQTIDTILEKPETERTLIEKVQLFIYNLLQTLGFYGILLCAAVPNPFFDLAGMLCGHFQVPFYTFFGATFLGKSLIKTSFQAFAVVFAFSEGNLEWALGVLKNGVSPFLHSIVDSMIKSHIQKFTQEGPHQEAGSVSATLISTLWNLMLIGMVGYFFISLMDAIAVQELRRDAELIKATEETITPLNDRLNLSKRRRSTSSASVYQRNQSWIEFRKRSTSSGPPGFMREG
ncbi:hypothetical protein BDR26DRAFT_863669 [Obelidium mucronatum]|nr:hypothetical protein BDR26DRAFT_863669 [Obelidium mucronatum]